MAAFDLHHFGPAAARGRGGPRTPRRKGLKNKGSKDEPEEEEEEEEEAEKSGCHLARAKRALAVTPYF